MKVAWWWKLIDGAVNVIALYFLYTLFGWQAAAIGFGIAIWNFIDGLVRG